MSIAVSRRFNSAGESVEFIEQYIASRYSPSVRQREGAKTLPRQIAKLVLTAMQSPLARRKAGELVREQKPLRLHLGCGDTYLEGWINIDYARPGRRQDLNWDLRKGLPFPSASVDMIFSEHMLEHVPLDSAFELLKECARILRPDHIFRLSVPSLELKVDQYLLESRRVHDESDIVLGPGMLLNELFYFHGHRTMFDFRLLSELMIAAGFVSVAKSEFGGGALASDLDSPERKEYSLYIEASR